MPTQYRYNNQIFIYFEYLLKCAFVLGAIQIWSESMVSPELL